MFQIGIFNIFQFTSRWHCGLADRNVLKTFVRNDLGSNPGYLRKLFSDRHLMYTYFHLVPLYLENEILCNTFPYKNASLCLLHYETVTIHHHIGYQF